ncbi:MAG TPA: choice-of-anchor D domain-containing protein, partial [Chloroflexota bacterium]|nr:choice-of-anchor D domain-containing protein [Chloroflexota bacterium]
MSKGRKQRERGQCPGKPFVQALEPRQLLATSYGSTETDVYWDWTNAGSWVESPITISDAPAGSVATSVSIDWKVDANDLTTLDYRLTGPSYTSPTYINLPWTSTDIFSSFAQTSESSQVITLPGNTAVNGTWSFGILESNDTYGMGRIDSCSITINYTTPAPEIQVTGDSLSIVDGETTPRNFGSAVEGGIGISKTFVVSNTGAAALILGSVSVPAGYTVTQALPASIGPGVGVELIVQLGTSTPGTFTGDISFSNNDADENPFNFRITGVVQALEYRDLYVDINSSGSIHDGSSWATAYTDLQLALSAANPGNRILIADGIYKPTAGTDPSISFVLKEHVSLLGGYAGYGTSDPNQRDTALYSTVLSGDIGIAGDNADNSCHVITGPGVTSATVLDGVVITRGAARGSQSSGGGIFLYRGSPTLINCTLRGNSAAAGGGMYNYESSPTLVNCSFEGNSAGGGGAIYNRYLSSPTLVNCSFEGNSAGGGGAIYNYYVSLPTLVNCSFEGNSAAGDGGAVYNHASSPSLTNSLFSGNWASSGG